MLITIEDHNLVADFCVHYRRSGFVVERFAGGVVEVTRPDAPTAEQSRREVELHLLVWQAVNPDTGIRCE